MFYLRSGYFTEKFYLEEKKEKRAKFICLLFIMLCKAYVTYVQPKLEYNTSVRSPYLQKDIISIESVQKSFTRKVCVCCNIPFSSYSDRLHKLNLRSLEYRRLEFDLILVYKICNDLIDIAFEDIF